MGSGSPVIEAHKFSANVLCLPELIPEAEWGSDLL